tara:strand:+ start:773 stop:1009 length:237 start_codon:yes stop_codon:yes gene_type:complete
MQDKQLLEDINKTIRILDSIKTVKNFKSWKWEKHFKDLDSAVDHLLKTLETNRKFCIVANELHKSTLLKLIKEKDKLH